MQVFSGFSNRILQNDYNALTFKLIELLSRRVLSFYRKQSVGENEFIMKFVMIITKLKEMENVKEIQPMMSQGSQNLTQFLHLDQIIKQRSLRFAQTISYETESIQNSPFQTKARMTSHRYPTTRTQVNTSSTMRPSSVQQSSISTPDNKSSSRVIFYKKERFSSCTSNQRYKQQSPNIPKHNEQYLQFLNKSDVLPRQIYEKQVDIQENLLSIQRRALQKIESQLPK